MNKSILKYIEMYRGEMPDDELLDDIICGAYLDEPECQLFYGKSNTEEE